METTPIESSLFKVAEIELVYKTRVKASKRVVLRSSKDAYELLHKTWDADKIEFVEQFKILLLNQGNKVLGMYTVSTGGICGTVADSRLIFAAALKANAVSIMLAHNHPSGNLQPSRADDQLTTKIKEAGTLLNIKVLDHLIISQEGYYSYADEGVL